MGIMSQGRVKVIMHSQLIKGEQEIGECRCLGGERKREWRTRRRDDEEGK